MDRDCDSATLQRHCRNTVKCAVRILVLAILGVGCHSSGGDDAPSAVVQVKTAVAMMQPFADVISSIGAVTARAGHFAALSAPASARVATVFVSLGERVRVGTPLVAFEQAPFIAAAQSAEAALTGAERNYERARRLADEGIVPRKDADQAATELAQARAVATTARRQAQLAVLRSPIAGVVTKLSAPIGATVDVAQPVVEIADLSALDILFNVSPSDAARIAPGAPVMLSAGESAKGEPLGIGRISDVGGIVDTATRSVSVRAQAPPGARPLRVGETIFGQITTAVHPRAIVIPVAALVPEGDEFKVFVVTAGNIARERRVTVGRRNETSAEIVGGLAAGERVVTEGAYGLEDSVRVEPAK